jgi:hypothetical protein
MLSPFKYVLIMDFELNLAQVKPDTNLLIFSINELH